MPPPARYNGATMIEVENLTKRYGEVLAVNDISFRVEGGRWSVSSVRTGRGSRRR